MGNLLETLQPTCTKNTKENKDKQILVKYIKILNFQIPLHLRLTWFEPQLDGSNVPLLLSNCAQEIQQKGSPKANSVFPPISNSLGESDCANWSPWEIIAYRRAIYSDNIKWLQLFTVWQFYCSHVRPNQPRASGRSSDGMKGPDPPLTLLTGQGVTLQLKRRCLGSASFLVIISDLYLYHELWRMISVLVISLLHNLYFSADCTSGLHSIVNELLHWGVQFELHYISCPCAKMP